MRTQFICLALVIVLGCPVASAQWVRTNVPYNNLGSCFAVHGTSVFAGTWGGGVFLSTDSGTSWIAASTGLANPFVMALAVSGTNLLAGTHNPDGPTKGGLFLSTNKGKSWTAQSAIHNEVQCFAASGANLFAGTLGVPNTDSSGLYLSTNNGTSWSRTGFGNETVRTLAVSGTNLYAGDGGGVFLSADSGTSWRFLFSPFPDEPGLRSRFFYVLCVCEANLFAGTNFGLFLSTDSGTSWTKADSGLAVYGVSAVAVSGRNLFVGTRGYDPSSGGRGVFLSTDSGTSWTPFNTGLTDTSVFALAVCGTNLLAGTNGGVWRRPLSDLVGVKLASSELRTEFALHQNYPNPFNPSTTIKFELPRASHVNLTVYDILGRQVFVLVNERRDAGVHEVECDGANLASGVYLYRLQAGDFTQTKCLLLLK